MSAAQGQFGARSRPDGLARFVRGWTWFHLAGLAAAYAAIWIWSGADVMVALEVWFFTPIGIFGAIIANATGAGGGVVFVPAFNAVAENSLGLDPSLVEAIGFAGDSDDAIKTVGTSFLIQCFGMSVGALVWLRALYGGFGPRSHAAPDGNAFLGLCFGVLAPGVPTLLITQLALDLEGPALINAFKAFSLILGLSLLAFALTEDRFKLKDVRVDPDAFDYKMLFLIGVVGGFVTGLFSVGIGEFLVVYLIIRGYATTTAVAVAVVVSIVSVLCGVWFHVVNDTILWEIAALAIPGAMIGGFIARAIANALGANRLKIGAALWIILSSVYLIVT